MTTCKMAGCGGELDKEHPIIIKTGCFSSSHAYGCGTCKRLHFGDERLVSSRSGDPVYLDDEGRYYQAEGMELFIYSFPTKKYRDRRVSRKATFVAAIKAASELGIIEGNWLLAWNPRNNRWVPLEQVSELFE